MGKRLQDMRPVYVVGIGLHPYQFLSETSYVTLGLRAVREALADAGLPWSAVESAYNGTALLGMAPTRLMLAHLGATGIPMAQVENASASGSTAFRQAVLDVASGLTDVSLAMGVDKPGPSSFASGKAGLRTLDAGLVAPVTHFALLAERYMHEHGATPEDFALVVVKNSINASQNPYAQKPKARSLADVLEEPPLSGVISARQCCPIGEGAAAVIVASEAALTRFGISRKHAVQVLASALKTEQVYTDTSNFDAALTQATVQTALADAGIKAAELDVIEVHDAFAIEELFYLEAIGVAAPGDAPRMLRDGAFAVGGQVAVSPSGGLLCMGHPIGPTGVGQIAEITRQLRGEAGARQQPNARLGLAHMVGVGAVCAVHVLGRA